MWLGEEALASYLIERGWLDPKAVVAGELRVVPVSHRNLDFEVTAGRDGGFFVKQPRSYEPGSLRIFLREPAYYELIASREELADLVPLGPEYVHFDPGRKILVLRLVRRSETVAERWGRLPPDLPAEAGALFGRLHRGSVTAVTGGTGPDGPFPADRPAFLSVHRGRIGDSPTTGAGRVLSIVREDGSFGRTLDRLAERWRPACLIHGDVRFGNVLVGPGAGKPEDGDPEDGDPEDDERPIRLWLVDWELVDRGDPCWDLGCWLADWVAAEIFALEPSAFSAGSSRRASGPGTLPASSERLFAPFLESYRRTIGEAIAWRRNERDRVIAYCGVRLVQLAFENAKQRRRSRPYVDELIRLGRRFVVDPAGVKEEMRCLV